MAGMVPGDVREIVVTIPQTWETERLRGVPARCTVKVNEVFKWDLPEVRGPGRPTVYPNTLSLLCRGVQNPFGETSASQKSSCNGINCSTARVAFKVFVAQLVLG